MNIMQRIVEVFGSEEKADRWLNTEIPSLGNQTPLSMIIDGTARIEDVLGAIEHGTW